MKYFNILFVFILLTSVVSGVALADEMHEWAFDEPIENNWENIEHYEGFENITTFSRNETYHTKGFYSLRWKSPGNGDSGSSMRTRDRGFINNDSFSMQFDFMIEPESGTEHSDEMRVRLITPERDIILFGLSGVQDIIWTEGDGVSYVEGDLPNEIEWNTVVMDVDGQNVTTTVDNQTLSTTMDNPIQNPQNAKIRIEFEDSLFDSGQNEFFVDNIMVVTQEPSLIGYGLEAIIFTFAMLFAILYVGIRLYSIATLLAWSVNVLATIGVLVFEMEPRYLWLSYILSIIVIALSAADFYNN